MPKPKDHRARSRQKFLTFESLEERTVLAGNVFASVVGGNLRLIGDAQDNSLLIERTGPTSVSVSSLDGTTRINNQAGPITFNNFTSGVTAVTGAGNDTLRFQGSSTDLFRVFGNGVIDTGSGDDTVEFGNFSVWNTLVLSTGAGNDTVTGARTVGGGSSTTGWGLRVGQDAVISTGTGNDTIDLRNGAVLRNFVLDAGLGNDTVDLRNNDFQRLTVLNGSLGFDTLNSVGNTFRYTPTVLFFESRTSIAGPTAVNDTATVAEGGTVAIPILANDSAGSGTLNVNSVVITQQPTNGTVAIGANGVVTYTSNGAEVTSDSFRYTVRDSQGNLSNEATVSIGITPVNDLPVAVADTITVAEGGSVTVNIGANDTDAEGQVNLNSIQIVTQPVNGTVTVGQNGNITYTHNGSETTVDSFTYTIADASGAVSAAATVTVNITPVNDLPTLTGFPTTGLNLQEDTPSGQITLTVGDAETPAGQLLLTAVSSNTDVVAASGIALGGSGAQRTLTITPVANASGTTTITLTLADGNGGTVTQSFQVNVAAVNDPPTVSTIADITVPEDSTIAPITVTVGDVETAAAALNVTAVSSNPAIATVAVSAGANASLRNITVTPVLNATGSTTITVTVTDAGGAQVQEVFVVTLTPVNDAPTISAVSDINAVLGATIPPITVTVGDVETPPASLTVTAVSSNTALIDAGDISISTNGNQRVVTITPNAGVSGTSLITLTVSDGSLTATETFTVTVSAPPTISTVADIEIDEDGVIAPINVTVGDLETPAANLTVTASSNNQALIPNANISVTGNTAARVVTITPVANASGEAEITLTVTDADGLTSQETFLVTVNPVNDAPTIQAIADLEVAEDVVAGPIAIDISDVETAANELIVTVTSSDPAVVAEGGLQLGGSAGARTLLLTPVANASGSTLITVTVQDANGATTTETFTLTVTPVDDAPTANADFAAVLEGDTVNIDVAANDLDVDGTLDLSAIEIVTQPQFGTVTVEADGTITYRHDDSPVTSDSFTYRISDSNGNFSAAAAVDIAVTLINDAPLTAIDEFTIDEGSTIPIIGNLLANDTDEEDDPLSISALAEGQLGAQFETDYGFVTINADGTFQYELKPDVDVIADLVDLIGYEVTDGELTAGGLLFINIRNTDG